MTNTSSLLAVAVDNGAACIPDVRWYGLPAFAHRQIASIRPSDIQAWVRHVNEGREPNTVKVAYRQLATIFRAAVDDGLIASSPCTRNVKLPRVTRKTHRADHHQQVHALVEHAPEHLRAFMLTAAGSGMRQGEAIGLTVDRIDFLHRTMRVDRQLVKLVGEPPKLAPPKTDASMRTIPVPQLVIDALAAHLAQFPSHDFVFKNSHGTPWGRRSFLLAFAGTVRRAELAKTITCHDLRHYYASLLIRHGESVKTVRARLGHASAKETLDTYGHLSPTLTIALKRR